MDKRTRKYRKKLEKSNKFWVNAVIALLGFSLACVVYIIFLLSQVKEAKAYSALEVISPLVSREPANEVNMHCQGEYEKLFCNADYDWDTKKMIAIATCESGMNPDAMALEPNGTWSGGLLQINSVHGNSPSKVFDPVENIKMGYEVFKSQGYEAWSVTNSLCYYQALASL